MGPLPRELLWAVIIALTIVVIAIWPSHQQLIRYTPNTNSQQQSEHAVSGNNTSQHNPPSTVENRSYPQDEHSGDNTSEVTILGIKPGEWLLGIVTWMLWLATVRLVQGADKTSERQLRAYVSVEPKIVYNFGSTNLIVIGVDTKNHGQTPATEISHDYSMGLLPNPLPAGFVFPAPARQLDTNNSLFPDATVPVRFPHDKLLTPVEAAAVATETERFHIWGQTHYRDAFGTPRTTQISASFGGPDFAQTIANAAAGVFGPNGTSTPGWFWQWGEHHNDAT
jgi:hypothetical protein